ncbi:hypothetical protein FRC12_000320 [Ceratobasidium sp. 428]|nr:hypothetical protein FRC12_000320 [Ceratobasidium sp. 428]
MYGICVDGNDGPRRSTKVIARHKIPGQHHAAAWIEEKSEIISENIETETIRDSNYVHQGWSAAAAVTVTPWAASRIDRHPQANKSGQWTTKRTIVQRLNLNIPPEDMSPTPAFEADVQAALGKRTALEKFKALNKVFQLWGDVVPIAFELGALLAISDTDVNFTQLSASNSSFRLEDLSTYKTSRVNIRGGDTTVSPDNIVEWLSRGVHPFGWAQARIIRVIPTTDLLGSDLKAEIEALYSRILSYCPSIIEGNSIGGGSFDGTPLALKPIKSIVVHAGSLIDSLATSFSDGTTSDRYGGAGGPKQVFCLRPDEFVIEVVVWTDEETTCGIQFVTNKGKISPHYGGDGGTPSVLNCDGGALAAFAGKVKKNMVYRVQTIWRHDMVPLGLTRGHQYSAYIGGVDGAPFNDWPYRHSLDTAYISKIGIRSAGKYIESVQATYNITHEGRNSSSQGAWHGSKDGQAEYFLLNPGEYFVTVQGRRNDWIVQLCFITNKGRSSRVFGGTSTGEEFKCFIMGKRLV